MRGLPGSTVSIQSAVLQSSTASWIPVDAIDAVLDHLTQSVLAGTLHPTRLSRDVDADDLGGESSGRRQQESARSHRLGRPRSS